jgi:hypothetical protein
MGLKETEEYIHVDAASAKELAKAMNDLNGKNGKPWKVVQIFQNTTANSWVAILARSKMIQGST